jgi:hypothetical protein
VKWDDNLTQALCQLWIDQYHLGNVSNGKLTPGGWSNLVAAFKDTTGRPYSKGQIDYQLRQLRKVFTAVKKLKRGSGGGRTERGGFIASENAWNEIKVKSWNHLLRFVLPHLPCGVLCILVLMLFSCLQTGLPRCGAIEV